MQQHACWALTCRRPQEQKRPVLQGQGEVQQLMVRAAEAC